MAFSWERVKKNSFLEAKKHFAKSNNLIDTSVNTQAFFGFINGLDNVSKDVKKVLVVFTDLRMRYFGIKFWNLERFKFQVKDLISRCCNKNFFIDVTKFDTEVAKNEIAFQCKCHLLLSHKDKRRLSRKSIYTENYEIVHNQIVKDNLIEKIKTTTKMETTYIEEYFSRGWKR